MSGRRESVTVFAIGAGVCFICDVVSKFAVAAWVQANDGVVVLIPGWLQFVSRLNQGGMWSVLGSMGESANLLLTGLSCVAVLAILLWGLRGLQGNDRLMAVTLGAILGGACGNLFDRIMFGGVRDFIDAHYHEVYHYPTFNLADSFLVCGAIVLVLGSMRSLPEHEESETAATAVATGTER